jgi:hypothetical protein
MGNIDVGSPGWGIDRAVAEFRFDGDRLSAAIESMDFDEKTDEEMIHFQGLTKPQDRTLGQDTFSGNFSWGLRQFINFAALIAANDGVTDMPALDYIKRKEFTFTCIASPPNDSNRYKVTFQRLRLLGLSSNIDQAAAKAKVPFSFMDRDIVPVPVS